MQKQVLIIGAGLTGLLLAYRLKKQGIKVIILEARDRIGGRIHTLHTDNGTPIEMGATWLGTQHTALIALLRELNIPVFPQFMDGKAFYEPIASEPPQEVYIPKNDAPSYRIKDGSHTLILKLAAAFTHEELIINTPVTEINFREEIVQVVTVNRTYKAATVVSTLPPKLLVQSIVHLPQLHDSVKDIATKTHTWMGTSIKFGVSYTAPFWRTNGYSGTLFSNIGPITEAYDHTNTLETKYALKGFLNSALIEQTKTSREAKVIAQLKQLFGDLALEYISYEECVWQDQPYTSMAYNDYIFPHQNNGHRIYRNSYYDDRYIIAGSETAAQFGGYMEGAVQSAESCFKRIMA